MEKKLYRNTENKMICGVVSGLAEYIGMDVTLLRVLVAASSFFAPSILIYIVCAVVMPVKPPFISEDTAYTQDNTQSFDK